MQNHQRGKWAYQLRQQHKEGKDGAVALFAMNHIGRAHGYAVAVYKWLTGSKKDGFEREAGYHNPPQAEEYYVTLQSARQAFDDAVRALKESVQESEPTPPSPES